MSHPVSAFIRRDAQIAWSYKLPVLVEVPAALFIIIEFALLSKVVSPADFPDGYLAFVVVGLAATSFLTAGVAVLAAGIRQEQVQGTLEAMLSFGTPIPLLAAGMACYPMVTATIRAAFYLILGAVAGASISGANWPLAAAATILGAVAYTGIGISAVGLVLILRQAAGVTGWLMTLLALLGGVIFPVQLLPSWAESLSRLSPFTVSLELTRNALLAGSSWGSQAADLAWMTVLAAGYALLGIGALVWALRRSRRTGSLTNY